MPRRDYQSKSGSETWRSRQELAGSEEFHRHLEAEFLAEFAAPGDGLSRRRFLQLMSASIAMATLAGCRWPEEKIVPFVQRPEDTTPGTTKRFATTLELAGAASGVLVTSFDGRPIKIEGNPNHPFSLGAADVFAQASILELYDPDRSQSVIRREGHQTVRATWDDFAQFAREQLALLNRGQGLAVLSEASDSPSVAATSRRFAERFPGAQCFTYEPIKRDIIARGVPYPYRQHLDLTAARIIVDLNADLLGRHPTALRNAHQFAAGRAPSETMNRLYAFEPSLSVTGAAADHRYATPAVDMPLVAGALAAELTVRHRLAVAAQTPTFAHLLDHPLYGESTAAITRDLLANRGRGVIVAGPGQPRGVHEICHVLNDALNNSGRTATYEALSGPAANRGQADDLTQLATMLKDGLVKILVILGGNPAYDAPVDLEFALALGRVPASVHLSLYENETSRLCSWHLPRAHPLESWGDARSYDGTVCAVQPLIAPLYGGKTAAEMLSLLADDPARDAHGIARRTFHQLGGGQGDPPANDPGFERRWREYLRDGFLRDSARDLSTSAKANPVVSPPDGPPAPLGCDNLELNFSADGKTYDGRFANNAWLQELPDFATKLTWDNAALMSPATAAELDVDDGDVVTLHFRNRQLAAPVIVLPGHAGYAVTVSLGYGRTAAGRVGNGVGSDTYRLRTSDAPWGGPGLRIAKTGRKHELACTQDHFAIDRLGSRERARRTGPLVREGDLAHYREHPDFARHLGVHHPPLISLWREHPYPGHRWAMAVDLNLCIGCNACVIACQAENNIPVVGKDQVRRGREMHWIRIDRYFRGDPSAPSVAFQPVGCVHCEMAPCETVCPVAATVHSREGLNTMVYNRCVGTRYCSNNCPFKVRRFNFFNYHKHLTETQEMAYNPEVTVRSRGVMEKCTYCVQRIQNARIQAKRERRPLRDGDIVPACAQTCPTGAIVFGDLNDPDSRVAQRHSEPRAYTMLAEQNLKPRTAYLARIRNPNPEIDGEEHEPTTGQERHG